MSTHIASFVVLPINTQDISTWPVVGDRQTVRGFYQGEEAFFAFPTVVRWLVPMLSWSPFILLVVLLMALNNVIIRKQWTEREKLIWWPFHPAGCPLGAGFAIDDYWFTRVLASALKWVVLKHGGARRYRRSIPFFLGLVLREHFVACGWALPGILIGRSMYEVWV